MTQYIALNFDDMELLVDQIFESEYDAESAVYEYCINGQWEYNCTRYNIYEVDVHWSGNPTPAFNLNYACIGDDYDGAEECNCPVGYGATPIEAVKDWLNLRA